MTRKGSAWVSFELFMAQQGDFTMPSDLPSSPACYAIWIDGTVVYVGQTVNLRQRICSYPLDIARYSSRVITPWGTGLKVLVKYRPARKYGDWAMVELRLIKRLKPAGNIVHNRERVA